MFKGGDVSMNLNASLDISDSTWGRFHHESKPSVSTAARCPKRSVLESSLLKEKFPVVDFIKEGKLH